MMRLIIDGIARICSEVEQEWILVGGVSDCSTPRHLLLLRWDASKYKPL